MQQNPMTGREDEPLTTEDIAHPQQDTGVRGTGVQGTGGTAGAPLFPGEAATAETGQMPEAPPGPRGGVSPGEEPSPGASPGGGGEPGPGPAGTAEEPSGAAGGAGEDRPLLGDEEGEGFRSRWQEIQSRFVDDPREAVRSADALVAEVVQELAATFSGHRQGLEDQWNRGEQVATEDLRIALQRYRSFFNRLLRT
ncbi:hypothetical protein [Streptomyces sp. HB2AG]|uniref:hypothetical protein n=1 Tax=Streptomyces sp. HB2AG TaxID=2983400 RepID=UPI0022AB3BC3|nr:hypothetical protein [Streptomyces sp. HB2AG]MCZ2524958.1 hypothetical protein [Streptomyces sp. HB2AG]